MANGAPRLTLGQFLMAMHAEKLPPQEIEKGRRWYVQNALAQDPEWAALTKEQQKEYTQYVLRTPAPDIWYEEAQRARGHPAKETAAEMGGVQADPMLPPNPFEAPAFMVGGGAGLGGLRGLARGAGAGLTSGLSEVPILAKQGLGALARTTLGQVLLRRLAARAPGTAAWSARRMAANPLQQAAGAGIGAAGRELGAAQGAPPQQHLEEFLRMIREGGLRAAPEGAVPSAGGLPPVRRIVRDPVTGDIVR